MPSRLIDWFAGMCISECMRQLAECSEEEYFSIAASVGFTGSMPLAEVAAAMAYKQAAELVKKSVTGK